MNRTDLQLMVLVTVLGLGGRGHADESNTIGPLGLSEVDKPTFDLTQSEYGVLGVFDPMMIETDNRELAENVVVPTSERRTISDQKLIDKEFADDIPLTDIPPAPAVPTLSDLPRAESLEASEYRFRVGDEIGLMFTPTTLQSIGDYRLVVGDELVVESNSHPEINRGTLEKGLAIQPDGTITLRRIGRVHAAGQTVDQLRELLRRSYRDQYPEPDIDVTPVNTGDVARKIRESIGNSNGLSGRRLSQKIAASGRIRLPQIGLLQAEGLTRDELKQEINLRYDDAVGGLAVDAILKSRSPDHCLVLGQIARPGYQMLKATSTVADVIAMSGGDVPGANLTQVVVFRRSDSGSLQSAMVDLSPTDGKPVAVRDGDLIVVPNSRVTDFNRFAREVLVDEAFGGVPLNLTRDLDGNVVH